MTAAIARLLSLLCLGVPNAMNRVGVPLAAAAIGAEMSMAASTYSTETFADGVPASATRQLVDIYQRAARRIQEAVTKPTGGTFNARQFNTARAAALARQIDHVLADLKGRTIAWTARSANYAYNNGLASALAQLKRAGVADADVPVRGGFTQVDRRTVAVIAADMAADLEAAAADQAAAAKRFLRAAAQRIVPDSELSKVVAEGAVTGDVRAAVRQMRGLLNAQRIEDYRRAGQQIIEVGKAHMTVAAYAEMLVRTRTREATVQARHERLVGNGFSLVTIVGAVSENFCTAYLGRVFSITGGHPTYPALASLPGGGPPFHPNCSKSTAAYVERFASQRQQRQAQLADRRFITRDAAEAQRIFEKTGEVRHAAARYRTRSA